MKEALFHRLVFACCWWMVGLALPAALALSQTPAPAPAAVSVTVSAPVSTSVPASAPATTPSTAVPTTPEELSEILVQADEPRFVAPTRRDRIGRIWAPVFINHKGPYRLVLDTGASHSAVMASVALSLGILPDPNTHVMLRGVTGSASVPVIRVDSLQIGDLLIEPIMLPIVTDALGGAEGILGTEGLVDKRIFIDFRNDRIRINTSRGERAAFGFFTVPVKFLRGKLLVVDATVGDIHAKAIIDTGGQSTIANRALLTALNRARKRLKSTRDEIVGATLDVQIGDTSDTPPIQFGAMQIRGARVTFGDMHIFEHWGLTNEPAMLIGMDALGLVDTLIIDYRRRELQIKPRRD
jgi:predicted aspartyl protease